MTATCTNIYGFKVRIKMGVPAGFKDFPDLIQFDSGQSQGISYWKTKQLWLDDGLLSGYK